MSSSRKKGKSKGLNGDPEVCAAGGLVWRATVLADEQGETRDGVEIVLVHRPSYDDWSFPKGKLDKRESFEDAAVREVAEETGLVCELGRELPSTRYVDGKGRLKLVRYWAMHVVGVEPWAANEEIDRRRWVTFDEAEAMLTYEHDRVLLGLLRDERG